MMIHDLRDLGSTLVAHADDRLPPFILIYQRNDTTERVKAGDLVRRTDTRVYRVGIVYDPVEGTTRAKVTPQIWFYSHRDICSLGSLPLQERPRALQLVAPPVRQPRGRTHEA